MTFQGGAVRVKQDFTSDRAALQEVVETLIYGEKKDARRHAGSDDRCRHRLRAGRCGVQHPEHGSPVVRAADGRDDAAESAGEKSLVYFASGLRLNGVDNQAQLRATINAAIRANVAIYPIDARGLVAMAPLGDATQPSPAGLRLLTGQTAQNVMSNFQRSQDTLYSLAKDTGGKALFDNNDLSLGIVQAASAIRSYYIIGFYQLAHRAGRPLSSRQGVAHPRPRRRPSRIARAISRTRPSPSSRRPTRSASSRTR